MEEAEFWTHDEITHCEVGFAFPLLTFGVEAALVDLDFLEGCCEQEIVFKR